jgi:hypothetical protein
MGKHGLWCYYKPANEVETVVGNAGTLHAKRDGVLLNEVLPQILQLLPSPSIGTLKERNSVLLLPADELAQRCLSGSHSYSQ